MSVVRTRMAPSPTGEYHIGHIRTVLYNYALAKKNQGQFIIRIEDTDQERLVPGAVQRILNIIRQYGFDWDEGPDKEGKFGPYVQSERLDIYQDYVQKLIDGGFAYRCFCTKDDLEQMRAEQREKGLAKTMYDGRCRKLSENEVQKNIKQGKSFVVRLKVPADGTVKFSDVVYGELEFDTNEIDDTVLLKSDGYPTYHLAVVVDDHLMEITHILRGNDWLPSTPKHILLYSAFGWKPPVYVHLPNLKEQGENKKLSKRFGSVYAEEFLKEGYLVEALLNFLMFLGWNPGGDKEIYSLDEFIEDFSLERIHKTDLVAFDREKLLWLNGYYIRNMDNDKLFEEVVAWAKKYDVKLPDGSFTADYKEEVIGLIKERMKKLSEYSALVHYFYTDPTLNKKLLSKYAKSPARTAEILQGFYETFSVLPEDEWRVENIEGAAHDFVEKNGFKNKEAFMTLRIAVTGEEATPPIFDILKVLGKERSLERIKKALKD